MKNAKKIVSLIMVLCILTTIVPFVNVSAQSSEVPVVFNNTFIAAPGEAIGVYGGNFGTDTNGITLMLMLLSDYDGEQVPQGNVYNLPILNMTDTLLQSAIPGNVPKGNYVLWVKTNAGFSKPFFINTPQVDWVSENEVVSGMNCRIFGRNFLNPLTGDKTDARVVFCETGSDVTIDANITAVTAYTVDFIVPDGLKANKRYAIKYNNGGSDYGWDVCPSDQAVLARASNANYTYVKDNFNGLELGWAGFLNLDTVVNVKTDPEISMKGDGSNDYAAFIKAINKMEKLGGGILLFPQGTYDITNVDDSLKNPDGTHSVPKGENIQIPDNIVFVGEGDVKIEVKETWKTKSATASGSFKGANYGGIYNINFVNLGVRPEGTEDVRRIGGYMGNPLYLAGADMHYFIKDVDMYNADGSSVQIGAHNHVVIDGCDFNFTHQGPSCGNDDPTKKFRLTNSKLRNTQRSIIWAGEHSWIEGNYLLGECAGSKGENRGATLEHRILESGGNELYFSNNTIDGIFGDPRTDAELVADGKKSEDNCGEGIANQAQKRFAYSRVTSATKNTLLDGSRNYSGIVASIKGGYEYNELYGPERAMYAHLYSSTSTTFVNKYIAIIGGKGVGQIRKISAIDGAGLVVDEPWDIIPDSTSVYTIDQCVTSRYIFAGNIINAECRKGGIMFYCKNADNIVDGNIMGASGGIWFSKNVISEERAMLTNGTPRADFSYYNYVANNELTGGVPLSDKDRYSERSNSLLIGPGTDGGCVTSYDQYLNCTVQYGSIYRNNTIVGSGTNVQKTSNGTNANYVTYNGILISATPDKGEKSFPSAQGMIVDGNKVTNSNNGVYVCFTSWDTLIYKNDITGNGVAINDPGQGSVNTIVSSETTQGSIVDPSMLPRNIDESQMMPEFPVIESMDEDIEYDDRGNRIYNVNGYPYKAVYKEDFENLTPLSGAITAVTQAGNVTGYNVVSGKYLRGNNTAGLRASSAATISNVVNHSSDGNGFSYKLDKQTATKNFTMEPSRITGSEYDSSKGLEYRYSTWIYDPGRAVLPTPGNFAISVDYVDAENKTFNMQLGILPRSDSFFDHYTIKRGTFSLHSNNSTIKVVQRPADEGWRKISMVCNEYGIPIFTVEDENEEIIFEYKGINDDFVGQEFYPVKISNVKVGILSAWGTEETQYPIYMDDFTIEKSIPYANGVSLNLNSDYSFEGDYEYITDANNSEYRWLVSDTANGKYEYIDGATSKTFRASPNEMGKYIKFEVIPKNASNVEGYHVRSKAILAPTTPVALNVQLTGDAEIGSELTVTYDFFSDSGAEEGETKVRWLYSDSLNGEYTPIQGATGLSFVITPDLDGKMIRAEITPVDSEGLIGSFVRSEAIGIGTPVVEPEVSNVTIEGNTTYTGETLTAEYNYFSSVNAAEGDSIFKWMSSDSANGIYSEISGISGEGKKEITVPDGYIGKYIKVMVIPVDIYGNKGEGSISNAIHVLRDQNQDGSYTDGGISYFETDGYGFKPVYIEDFENMATSKTYTKVGSNPVTGYTTTDGKYLYDTNTGLRAAGVSTISDEKNHSSDGSGFSYKLDGTTVSSLSLYKSYFVQNGHNNLGWNKDDLYRYSVWVYDPGTDNIPNLNYMFGMIGPTNNADPFMQSALLGIDSRSNGNGNTFDYKIRRENASYYGAGHFGNTALSRYKSPGWYKLIFDITDGENVKFAIQDEDGKIVYDYSYRYVYKDQDQDIEGRFDNSIVDRVGFGIIPGNSGISTWADRVAVGAKEKNVYFDDFIIEKSIASVKGVKIQYQDGTMTGVHDSFDYDLTYKWLVSDNEFGNYSYIDGAETMEFTPGNEYQNKYIKFETNPNSTEMAGHIVRSKAVKVGGASIAPVASEVAVSGIAKVGNTLKLNYVYSSDTNEYEGESVYRWLYSDTVDGDYLPIAGAETDSFLIPKGYGGKFIKAEITPVDHNGLSGSPVLSDARSVQIYLPVASNVLILGSTEVGETLTGDYDFSSAMYSLEGNTAYRWLYCNTIDGDYAPIVGATTKTFVITEAYADKYIKFEVSPMDEFGFAGSIVLSAPVKTAIVKLPPQVTNAKIGGTGYVGGILAIAYDYFSPVSSNEKDTVYQWLVADTENGSYAPINEESSKTFIPSAIYNGKYIKAGITPVDAYGTQGSTVYTAPIKILLQKTQLSISILGGGSVTYNISGDINTISNTMTGMTYNAGSSVELTAKPRVGYEFLCWSDIKTNRVFSFDSTYSFILGSNINVSAQFISTSDAKHYVMFKDRNNEILSTQTVNHGLAAVPPTVKNNFTGYIFMGWDLTYSQVVENMVISALYNKDINTKYNINVENGVIKDTGSSNGIYPYDTKITVVANSPESGQYFWGWKLAGGEDYVSYDVEYSFLVSKNATITAVYGNTPIDKIPTIVISATENTGGVSFHSLRNIPTGFAFVESGILVTKGESVNANDLLIGNPLGITPFLTGKTTLSSPNGQYQYNITTAAGNKLHARAYLIYIDNSTNAVITIYSDVVSGVAK